MADRMVELAAQQPGFLGVESTRGADGLGITVSYWASLEAIAAWTAHAEHRVAQTTGRQKWYQHFETRMARVERAYGGPIRRVASRDVYRRRRRRYSVVARAARS